MRYKKRGCCSHITEAVYILIFARISKDNKVHSFYTNFRAPLVLKLNKSMLLSRITKLTPYQKGLMEKRQSSFLALCFYSIIHV